MRGLRFAWTPLAPERVAKNCESNQLSQSLAEVTGSASASDCGIQAYVVLIRFLVVAILALPKNVDL